MTALGAQGQIDLDSVYRAIHTLYSHDQSIPYSEKQAASTWLNEFQGSVSVHPPSFDIFSCFQHLRSLQHLFCFFLQLLAWEISDQLLHRKASLESCYFGAHTIRTKIQGSFHELPSTSHCSLRDSLLQHIAAITSATDHIIVTQLCLAVTHLVLQSNTWADPIGHLLNTFGADPTHWWPVLEILTLLPEEVHSRKIQLGENRRHQVTNQLESTSPTILAFLKQSLNVCISTPPNSELIPVETCLIGIVRCFGSWVLINPECFFLSADSGAIDVLNFTMSSLRSGKVSLLHNYLFSLTDLSNRTLSLILF